MEKTINDIGQSLTVKDILKVHDEYTENIEEWRFLMAMYEGIRKIIKQNLVQQHERESSVAYARRMEELYGLGYTKSVVEIFNFFVFKAPSERVYGRLADFPLWEQFLLDADLYGNNYSTVLMDISLYAAVQGHMGILVDKANVGEQETVEYQIDNQIYPYIAKYFPPAILDWEYKKNEFDRPYLAYVKLKDDNDQYRIWTPAGWEIWEMPDDYDEMKSAGTEEAVLVDRGINPLGEVPFIWHYNLRSKTVGVGISDVHEVSRIDLSIIRNISQIEEIIYYAAFPMMRKPMRDASPTEMRTPQGEDEVGVKAILEFDPEHPDAKPDWLPAEVAAPIDATTKWIEKKVSEIYRAANIGGLAATEPTASPQSGVAKRIDFQMLNAKLVNKSINLQETENKIVELWLRWENLWEIVKNEISLGRKHTFDVEEVSTSLENALTAQMVIQSQTFNRQLQKSLVRTMLPQLNEFERGEIDNEIDTYEPAAFSGEEEIEENVGDNEETGRYVQEGQEGEEE